MVSTALWERGYSPCTEKKAEARKELGQQTDVANQHLPLSWFQCQMGWEELGQEDSIALLFLVLCSAPPLGMESGPGVMQSWVYIPAWPGLLVGWSTSSCRLGFLCPESNAVSILLGSLKATESPHPEEVPHYHPPEYKTSSGTMPPIHGPSLLPTCQ